MAILISSIASKALALYTPVASRHRRSTVLSATAHRRQIFTSLSMKSWGINGTVTPARGATQIPAALPKGNLPIPNMPHWITLVVGAVFVAIPIYRKIRALEAKVEKTAEVAVQVIDTVAEAAEKVAGEVSEAFPNNENLKEAASRIKTIADAIEEEAASRIKTIADAIEEDAEKAEALIHKVDEIVKEVDSVVDPIIDKLVTEEPKDQGEVTQAEETNDIAKKST